MCAAEIGSKTGGVETFETNINHPIDFKQDTLKYVLETEILNTC